MANQSTDGDRLVDRRTVLQVGAGLAAAGRRYCAERMPKRSSHRKALPT